MKCSLILFAFLFLLISFACNVKDNSEQNSGTSQNRTDKAIAVDALSEQELREIPVFFTANFHPIEIPIKYDSINFDGKKELSDELLLGISKSITDEHKYLLQIPSYLKIREKTATQIENLEGFDIGEAIELNYYDMGYYWLDEEQIGITFLGIKYESFPACPWGRGKYVVVCSFDKAGKLIDARTVAEKSEGGDPPVWSKTNKQCNSETKKTFLVQTHNQYGEEDEMGNDIIQSQTTATQVSIDINGKMSELEQSKS